MTYVIRDDVLAPQGRIVLSYAGPNPFGKAYRTITYLFRTIFHAKGTHIFEPVFKWDYTGDPRKFENTQEVRMGLDKLTSFVFSVRFYGAQPANPEASGSCTFEIRCRIETVYKTNKLQEKFLLPFLYFYHITYYNKVRRRYIVSLQRQVEQFVNALRQTLQIPVKSK
jgi:hypothetical protein